MSEGTAFHILAFELILDDLAGCFFHYWCIFWVFLGKGEFVSQIDFIAHKDLWHVPHVLLKFWVPLNDKILTFFLALTNEDGSMTEKTMRKTSQLG